MASVWNKVREVVKLRYVVVGTVGPSAVYWYFRNEAWKQTLKDADELISAEFRELREISARAKASTPVMAAIHQLAWEQLPQRMGADEFGSWLVHSLKGNPPGLGDDGITAGYHDSSEITGLDPWDIHACLRTCESDPTGKLDLRDLLIASSALVKSENPFERIDLAWKVIDRSESGYE
jgi:hypothetical protein